MIGHSEFLFNAGDHHAHKEALRRRWQGSDKDDNQQPPKADRPNISEILQIELISRVCRTLSPIDDVVYKEKRRVTAVHDHANQSLKLALKVLELLLLLSLLFLTRVRSVVWKVETQTAGTWTWNRRHERYDCAEWEERGCETSTAPRTSIQTGRSTISPA